jgi:hypothetical protein
MFKKNVSFIFHEVMSGTEKKQEQAELHLVIWYIADLLRRNGDWIISDAIQ